MSNLTLKIAREATARFLTKKMEVGFKDTRIAVAEFIPSLREEEYEGNLRR